MLRSDVLPQPLGPTMAMNSPSATDSETSDSATTCRRSRSTSYRLVRPRISSLYIRPRLLESDRRLALLFRLHARAEHLLEVAFFDQARHGPVVDHFVEVVALQTRRDPRIDLLRDDGLHRRRQHVRHAIEDVAVLVEIVDASDVGFRLLVEGNVGLHRERLVVVEA